MCEIAGDDESADQGDDDDGDESADEEYADPMEVQDITRF